MSKLVNDDPLAAKAVEQAIPSTTGTESPPHPLVGFSLFLGVLTLCFGKPLLGLVKFCFDPRQDIYSYVLLIPFISAYLVWTKARPGGASANRQDTSIAQSPPSGRWWALACLVPGLTAILVISGAASLEAPLSEADRLSITMFGFVCLVLAGGFFFLGAPLMRTFAFPAAFLFFLAPFPDVATRGIEIFFQHTSAEAAHLLLQLSGTPVYREGPVFRVPGIVVEVAEECSGIRSSLVLFITSLLGGYMFLRSPWRRALFTLAVIPLAILRNGVRISTIAILCSQMGQEMIDSPIHRHGGPLFFGMSLVPLLVLLWWLRRKQVKVPRSTSRL